MFRHCFVYPKIVNKQWDIQYLIGISLITLSTITKQFYLLYGLVLAYLFIYVFIKTKKWGIMIVGFYSGIIIISINFVLMYYSHILNEKSPAERIATVQIGIGRLPFNFDRYLDITHTASPPGFKKCMLTLRNAYFYVDCMY